MSAATDAIRQYWVDGANVADVADKKLVFLQGLRESGTVLHACEFANISRTTAYIWRNIDPEFRADWDAALEDVTDNVERSLYRQAVSEKNVVATIFYLKANRAKYRDRLQIDVPQLQRQVEDRVSELQTKLLNTSNSSSSTGSTKDLIAEVIGTRRTE